MLSRVLGLLPWLLVALAASAGEPLRLAGLAVEDRPTRAVVEHPTLVRALAPVRFASTLQTTEWLLDHPPLAAALARHLHPPLERYHLQALGSGRYDVNDQGALRGTLRLVAAAPARRVYLCEGRFRSLAHILTLNGTMVFTLEYRQLRDGSQPLMEVTPALYLRLDNVLAHGLVKVLGPLLHGVIDRRVASLTAATLIVGERITRDAAGLYREMAAWPDLQPGDLEAFRTAFLGDHTS
ncbi:MAG: hypothetical protein ACE147_03310 [Candidatus Methylomirabilales bacterium]